MEMMTYDEARYFSQHPVKVSDVHITRDNSLFDYNFTLFERFLIRELKCIIRDIKQKLCDPESLETRKRIANLMTMRDDLDRSCKAYAYHSKNDLLPRYYSL